MTDQGRVAQLEAHLLKAQADLTRLEQQSAAMQETVAKLTSLLTTSRATVDYLALPFEQQLIVYFNMTEMPEPAFHALLDKIFAAFPANRKHWQYGVLQRPGAEVQAGALEG